MTTHHTHSDIERRRAASEVMAHRLTAQLGADPKMVADQLGHSVDVSLNVCTQSAVASRVQIVNQLVKRLALQ